MFPKCIIHDMEECDNTAIVCESIAIVRRDGMPAVCKVLNFASVILAVSLNCFALCFAGCEVGRATIESECCMFMGV